MNVANTTNFISNTVESVIKLIIACLLVVQFNANAGYVLGRGVFGSEEGNTLWAEYNAKGGYLILDDIIDNDAHTVAGSTLLAYQNQLQAYEVRNENAQYLTKAAFDEINITAQNGELFNKPIIPEEARVVILPAANKILTEHHEFIEYIWLPYDLKAMGGIGSQGGQGIKPEFSSYLINKSGEILHQSEAEGSSIGPLNGYYYPHNDEGELILEQAEYYSGTTASWSKKGEILINPVGGVEITGAINHRGYSQADGWISGNLTYCNPQPPYGYHYDPGIVISARLPFVGFNATEPKQRAYYAYGYAQGCESYTGDIFVSMQSIMGGAKIFNPDEGIVPLTAKTSFHLESERNEATYLSNIDFDGDDDKDPASYLKYDENANTYTPLDSSASSEATHMGIYFTSGVEIDPDTGLAIPSIIRAVDRTPQYKNKGLLKTINSVDLAQTDLFIFRVSTGQLMTSHKGIEQGTVKDDYSQGGIFDDAFNFQFAMRGPDDFYAAMTPYQDIVTWSSVTKVTEPFQKENADHVRPGEVLQLIAINRASGYIGSVSFLSKQVAAGGDINNALDSIIMRPPNLKIWAERVHEIKQGKQVAGETESTNVIGNEGITLEDDLAVSIHTEWLDYNGLPLPAELGDYGYTARIAKITSVPTPDVDALKQNSSNEFAIKPGRNLNVLQFNQKELSRHHFYVQVNPYPRSQQNDFSSQNGGSEIYNPLHKNYLPDGSGTDEHDLPAVNNIDLQGNQTTQDNPLRYRPAHYVPFKVPLYDEGYSQIQQDVYDDLKEQHADNPAELEKLEKPDPLYRWYYRPELQFSQYSFDAKSLIVNQIDDEDEESITEIEIEEDGTDFAPIFDSYTDSVELLFDLLGPQLDRLPALENDREFVLSLGGEEAIATIGADGKVTFANPEHLTQLTEADLLSLRLYLNGDAGNVLWEYALEHLSIEPATIGYNNQTADTYYITADDPKVEMKSALFGYAYRDESEKEPVRVLWKAEGDGSFSPSAQTSTTLGMFDSTLTMSTVKGATAKVSVELIGDDVTASWKTVEVLAGIPDRLQITKTGQAVSWQQGDVQLDVKVYDKYGNLVEDGTEVHFDVTDSFLVKEQQLSTIDGHAFIILTGGEYSVDDSTVTIQSGSVESTEDLSIQNLVVELTAETTRLKKQQATTVRVLVTTPDGRLVNDVPVSFSANKGFFSKQNQLTNASGIAEVQFTAGLNELDDTWTAQVGYAGMGELAYIVRANGNSIDALDAMLVADEIDAGDITYDQFGISTTIGYQTSGTMTIRSSSDTNISIGDMADPNLEPLLSLSMNVLTDSAGQQQFQGNHGLTLVDANDVTIVADHPLGAGRSANFIESAGALIRSNDRYNLLDNIGTRIDLKPKGAGTVFEHSSGTQKLSYSTGVLTFTVKTDSGTYSVQAPNVIVNKWHSVATKVANNQIELYVDGTVYAQPISGSLLYASNKDIQIGGLNAVMRGFRLYDWSSQPLVTFADGSTSKTMTAGSETVTIKSLGNLDELYVNSELKSLRVAVIAGGQRNFASLLTKRGYQEIAQKYLSTISPQTPIALHTVPNPFNAVVPTAHAWSWGGVWDGVKDGIGYLIPYEDFIIIGEQLGYLMDKDWENFDPSALAFASLGAATILPIAKPLKPLLAPLKKVVDGMKRFPAAKHFAGAIGTAVKEGLSGKADKMINLLPFILIAVELYKDPEVFEFIMSAIESEDDLWVWIDVVASMVALEGGLDELSHTVTEPQDRQFVSNPVNALVASAYAAGLSKRQRIAQKIIDNVKKYSNRVPRNKAKQITEGWKSIQKHPVLKNLALRSGTAIRYFASLGGAKVAQFVRNSKNWRVNRWFVLFSVIYIAEEVEAERLDIPEENKKKFLSLIASVFSNRKNEYNGSIFQISQVAYFHAMSELIDGPNVIGVELERPAYYMINGAPSGRKAYKRRVDIVIESEEGGEQWVEVKSYAKSSFSNSTFKNTPYKKGSIYREFFHDLRLNDEFITDEGSYLENIIPTTLGTEPNDKFVWYFHEWRDTTKGIPPGSSEESKAQKMLCYKPNINNIKKYYEYNFSKTARQAKSACNTLSSSQIILRDTGSYLDDVLAKLIAAEKVDASDFLEVVKQMTDPDWL